MLILPSIYSRLAAVLILPFANHLFWAQICLFCPEYPQAHAYEWHYVQLKQITRGLWREMLYIAWSDGLLPSWSIENMVVLQYSKLLFFIMLTIAQSQEEVVSIWENLLLQKREQVDITEKIQEARRVWWSTVTTHQVPFYCEGLVIQ